MEATNQSKDVLVVGAGIAGIEASLLLAQAGRKVYLVEKSPSIGGNVIKFEEVFTNLECSTCMIAPKQQETLQAERIELLTLSQVVRVEGGLGDFKVTVKRNARWVDLEACIGCGACFDPCPVSLKNEFEEGLGERKAIYIPCAGALPNVPAIDREHCLRFTGEDKTCQACQEACVFEAIDFDQQDEELEIKVGAIVVATGYDLFDPRRSPQYGYGKVGGVYTAFEFERLFASNGPTGGEILLPNGNPPKSVAIIHCVGRKERGYCSAVCCMYALKFVHYLKSKLPTVEVAQLYTDFCIPGKSAQRFSEKVKGMGGDLIRAEVVEVAKENGNLRVKYNLPSGKAGSLEVDMVILAPAIEPRADAADLAKVFNIAQDDAGFFAEEHPEFSSVATPREGIFIVGCAQGPKNIQGSVAQSEAAVGRIISLLP